MTNINSKYLKSCHRAIFFDAAGTLLKPYPSVGDVYSHYAKKYGCDAEPARINQIFYDLWAERTGLTALRPGISEKEEKKWWRDLVSDVFKKIGPIERFDDFFEELYYSFASEKNWKVYDEVFDVLEGLKRAGYYLGVISNWDRRLTEILDGLKLSRYFDQVHISALMGVNKPDSRIFARALDHAGVLPEEAFHVGDSLEDDYYGARNAGLDACFLDRERTLQNSDIPIIYTLKEIF